MSHASGLAAAIRGATESETFDLAGQNTSTITTNITNAFQTSLPISDMIRVTFVTGAGKLARQKYDENAAKAVTSALRDLGFEEDRGASCIKECAGSFKLQHDTGKNLKTVVVFPRIQDENSNDGSGDGDNDQGGSSSGVGGSASFLPKGSPKEMIALASKTVFESMVKSRCQTWSQKKGCMAAIGEIKTTLETLEQKLLQGNPLADAEQTFYDQVSSTVLEEKQAYVKDLMQHQVDDGLIMAKEKVQLLSQVTERLETISKEIADAEKNKQAKKVEKLKSAKEKATTRKDKLSNLSPKPPPPLKHHAEIFQLRSELKPLLELEEGAKGRLLSVKETQSLARKDEILDEIASFEEKSRGWFEEDDIFQSRIDACNAAWASQSKSSKKGPKKAAPTSGAGSSKTSAWVTASTARPKSAVAKNTASQNKKTGGKGASGVFAAMMMDSDSD